MSSKQLLIIVTLTAFTSFPLLGGTDFIQRFENEEITNENRNQHSITAVLKRHGFYIATNKPSLTFQFKPALNAYVFNAPKIPKETDANAKKLREYARYKFRYETYDKTVVQAPHLVEQRQAGDCKDRALWLAHKLRGSTEMYYVVGWRGYKDKVRHAWIYYKMNGKWKILDPSFARDVLDPSKISTKTYLPISLWGKTDSYQVTLSKIP